MDAVEPGARDYSVIQLEDWARRWGIPHGALIELQWISVPQFDAAILRPGQDDAPSENAVSASLRVDAPKHGCVLMRNNSGVTPGDAKKGIRPVRYGLGNDSKNLNAVMKSSDLLGLDSRGRFLAVEAKPVGWRFKGTPREIGQRNFLDMVIRHGGVGTFATCWADVGRVL